MSEERVVCELAEWAAGVSKESIPASALHAARRLLVDRLAISLGGYRLIGPHPTCHLAQQMEGRPAATIWSTGREAFAPYAALANGSAGDILELEAGPDCTESAFAAAEIADATLGDLLAALAIAGEVAGYMRRWLSEPMERHGLHHPAALGAYSSATASGRLLGLSSAQLAGALASAGALAPQAPYGAFSAGATGKTLYGGWPHLVGLWSCLWATQGIAGPATLLEGPQGIAQAMLDAVGAVVPSPFQPASNGWEIENVTFKPFPCNRASHPALTALSRMGALNPNEIESVRVDTYPYAVELDRRSRGNSPIAAQVSVRKTVSLYLALGGLEPGHSHTPANLADPLVTDLAGKVTVELDPAYSGEGPRVRGALVTVKLKDGRILEERTNEPKWGSSNPATDAELADRFHRLVAGSASPIPLLKMDLWECPQDTPIRMLVRS